MQSYRDVRIDLITVDSRGLEPLTCPMQYRTALPFTVDSRGLEPLTSSMPWKRSTK